MKILLISPYHSGSHQAWAEGYARATAHDHHLLTLPGQLWKWRMQGAAVTLSRKFMAEKWKPDLILADDMLDLATFLAITRRTTAGTPAVLYMHENQLTYPLPEDRQKGPMRRNFGVRERTYVLINWKSMLAADAVWFNSRFHMNSWFEALPRFLNHYAEFKELETVEILRERSEVVPVGIDLKRLLPPQEKKGEEFNGQVSPPLILWNQRWEFDKNPRLFFRVLAAIQEENIPFRLAICGESFQRNPAPFLEARRRFAGELIHFGFAAEKKYIDLLQAADLVVSTARHEFFGISVLEGIAAGAFPILPARLSYPELIPPAFHESCLYKNEQGLHERLRWALSNMNDAKEKSHSLSRAILRYDWAALTVQYDQKLASIRSNFWQTQQK